jgi:hypothetical protein
MNRAIAIREWQEAMDEVARLSGEIAAVDRLIVQYRQHPEMVRRLVSIKARLTREKDAATARHQEASKHI